MGRLFILRQSLVDYAVIAALFLTLFVTLPVPVSKEELFCRQTACTGYQMQRADSHNWQWAAGYHIFLEPVPASKQIAHETKYGDISGRKVLLLAMASFVIAVMTYAILQIVAKTKL